MNCIKNVLVLTVLSGVISSIQQVCAVAHYGALLYKNKHYVTLIGEKHTRSYNLKKNTELEQHCITCFKNYPVFDKQEKLIVEAGEFYHHDRKLNEDILIEKLTKMSFSSNNNEIESYDLRAEVFFRSLIQKLNIERYSSYGPNNPDTVLGDNILKSAQDGLKKAIESLKLNKESYNDYFLDLIAPMKKLLDPFCKTKESEKKDEEEGNYSFSKVLALALEVFLESKNIKLGDNSLPKFTLQDSYNLLRELSDYGFIAKIGQAEKNEQNITLYTGSLHSKNIKKKLEEIGYKTIFFKDKSQENNGYSPLTEEDFDKLFMRKVSE